jgi:hypothetical protein
MMRPAVRFFSSRLVGKIVDEAGEIPRTLGAELHARPE